MRRRFAILDVFTARAFSGNPLAVVLDARGLDAAAMLAIAREFNFSETTFVLPPPDQAAARAVRIFTPGGEIPFAGHPTLGTAIALVAEGYVPTAGASIELTLALGAGPTMVEVVADANGYHATLTAPQRPRRGAETAPIAVAEARGLAVDAVDTAVHRPVDAGVGLDFLVVRLQDLDALAACRPQSARWGALASAGAGVGVLAYTPTTDGELRARMFAPAVGVPEDPATGSAAGALGGLLAGIDPRADGTLTWTIHQGVEMGRPSRLDVAADKRAGACVAVRVGGRAVLVADGSLLA